MDDSQSRRMPEQRTDPWRASTAARPQEQQSGAGRAQHSAVSSLRQRDGNDWVRDAITRTYK